MTLSLFALPRGGDGYTDKLYSDESLEELRALGTRFRAHAEDLKSWVRSGGPINPIWIRETHHLQKELHRTQCRAANRIFTSGQDDPARCLGAFVVYRRQRAWTRGEVVEPRESQRRNIEELMACKYAGGFERWGETDIAFVCDFCDGHLIWDDLEHVPTERAAQELAGSPIAPVSPTTDKPYWQARGMTLSTRESKEIVFAPVAIANHVPPEPASWRARLICPLCEDEGAQPQDKDDDEEVYRPNYEFEDLAALQEHFEWQHTSTSLPASLPISTAAPTNNCQIM